MVIAERRREVAALTYRGWSTRRIAEKLGVGHATVARDVDAVLTELVEHQAKDAEKIRARELETLAQAEAAVLDVLADDSAEDTETRLKAVDRVTKVQERRAKLLGLDAAIEIQVTQRMSDQMTAVLDALRGRLSDEAFAQVVAALGGGSEGGEATGSTSEDE